jgi:hypothetical protein
VDLSTGEVPSLRVHQPGGSRQSSDWDQMLQSQVRGLLGYATKVTQPHASTRVASPGPQP